MLAATGAAKDSIVGHSQGGMMPRYYLKFLGGAAKVDALVGLAPSNHGTTNPLLLTAPGSHLLPGMPPAEDRSATSCATSTPTTGLPGPVSYTNIVTQYDEVVCSPTPPDISRRRHGRPSSFRPSAGPTWPATC